MGKNKGKKKQQSQGEEQAAPQEQTPGPSRETSQPPESQSQKGKKDPQPGPISQGSQPGLSQEGSGPQGDQLSKGKKGKKKQQSQGEQQAVPQEQTPVPSRETSQPPESQSQKGKKDPQPGPISQGSQPGRSQEASGPQGDQLSKGKKGPQKQPQQRQDERRGSRQDQQQPQGQGRPEGPGRQQQESDQQRGAQQKQHQQGPRGPGQTQAWGKQPPQQQPSQQSVSSQQPQQQVTPQQAYAPPPQQAWKAPQQTQPPGYSGQGPPQGHPAGEPGYQQGYGAQGPPPGQQPARGPPAQRGAGRGQQQQQQRPYPAGEPGYQQGYGAQGPPPGQQPARGPPAQRGAGKGQQQQLPYPAGEPGYQQGYGAQGPPPGQQPARGAPMQGGDGRGQPQPPAFPAGQQGAQSPPPPVQQPARGPPAQKGTGKAQQPSQAVKDVTSGVAELQIARRDMGDANLVSKMRRQPGTKGRRIPVESNHLTLNLGTIKTAYHYDVAIEPDKPKKYMRPVIASFVRKHFSNRWPAFDGKKNLYTSSPLTDNLNDYFEDEVSLREDDNREKKFKVEIKFANKVDLTALHNLLQSPVTPQEALQVVDIVLRMAPVESCYPVGRSFFVKPQQIIDLGQGMEMYHGFYQSAIRGWKPLLNVDVAHKAFPKDINGVDVLIDLLSTPRQQFRREDLRSLDRNQEMTLNSFMEKLRVNYQIPNHPESRKGYRVNGTGQCAEKAIFTHENRKITIVEYFNRTKNYKIRYPLLPTLWVGNPQREDKILLPLELCYVCEGQAVNRKMTEMQTSNMIRHAATNTATRKNKIMQGIDRANFNNNACVKEFGFSVGNEFQKLDARVLQPPDLQYKNKTVRVSKGVWRNETFLTGVTINNWTITTACKWAPRPDDLKNMVSLFERSGRDCGMTFTSKVTEPFTNIGGRQDYRDIEQYFKSVKGKFDVIFVVVPDSGQQYSFVKKAAEIAVGCLTQCVKAFTVNRKMNQQTAVNILLKVNSKLNGVNHTFSPGSKPNILKKPVMIMGADVTHPGPGARDIPSVAAVTASHDPKAFKYNICWRLQNPKVEIIEDLEAIVQEQLKFFYKQNKVKPEAIVFFRDGVSEGQFQQVQNAEIRAIRSACKKMQADGYEPKITFLVVQKRHHTRLFPLNPRDSEDRNTNVPAGTCVDKDITHPFMQDFYLVSHASIQGVAKPTKYCTLWDDNDMDNDQVEELAYYLCHMFSRCNRSVSYPAPTYYAHLAAARAKVYIENDRLNMDRLRQEFDKFQIQDCIRKDLPMFFV